MRGELLLAMLLLVPLGFAAGAAGGDQSVGGEDDGLESPLAGIPSLPEAQRMLSGSEDTCAPSCEIQGSGFGWRAPVTVLVSNSTVRWVSVDADYHTAASTGPTYDRFAVDPCLFRGLSPGAPASATFRINNSGVDGPDPATAQDASLEIRKTKTVTEIVDGEEVEKEIVYWDVCEEAVRTSEGAFVLFYMCTVHPSLQKGQLVILPRV